MFALKKIDLDKLVRERQFVGDDKNATSTSGNMVAEDFKRHEGTRLGRQPSA